MCLLIEITIITDYFSFHYLFIIVDFKLLSLKWVLRMAYSLFLLTILVLDLTQKSSLDIRLYCYLPVTNLLEVKMGLLGF